MKVNKAAIPEVIDNVRRVFQVITDYSKTAEKKAGIMGPQLWALKILAKSSSLRVSELAKQMYLHPATVVGILDRLEGKGLVTRTRSMEDRRAVDLNLTEKGRDVVAKAPEVSQAMLVRGLDELTDEQFTRVREGMELLVHILGADAITPQPLHVKSEPTTDSHNHPMNDFVNAK